MLVRLSVERVVAALRTGEAALSIAKRSNWSHNSVLNIARAHGMPVKPRQKQITDQDLDLIHLYFNGALPSKRTYDALERWGIRPNRR